MTGRRVARRTQPLTPTAIIGRLALIVLLAAGIWVSVVDPFSLLFFVSYAVVGALLIARRPSQVIGWILVGLAFGFLGTTAQPGVDLDALASGGGTWDDFLQTWLSSWTGYATFSGFVALALVFPSGSLPVRGRRLAQLLLLCCAAVVVVSAVAPMVPFSPDGSTAILIPNRLAVLPQLAIWSVVPLDLLIGPIAVLLLVSVGWMLLRYRDAQGVERLQLRWLVAALAAVVVGLLVGLGISGLVPDSGGLAWVVAMISFPTVPIAIYVAITRHHLYDIDRVISRTLGWVLVSASVAAVFAIWVIGLQAVLAPITGTNTFAVAASTLVAVAAFQPLRARIQRLVDRRFDRARLDAERVVSGLAGALRNQVDLDRLQVAVVDAAEEAVAPAGAALWLRGVR